MAEQRTILIVGGGTAGWLTAAYLARSIGPRAAITLVESPGIGIIGVGEGAFPTIRQTLQYLGIGEGEFIRRAAATFKQGIRFDDWLHAPRADGTRHRYVHPFEAPFFADGANLVADWLAADPATRPSFAEAVTIQHHVAAAGRAPKGAGEAEYQGPLSYAYHFDAHRITDLLRERAIELGVRHLEGRLTGVMRAGGDRIAHVHTAEHGPLSADLFIDCSGFRAELIGEALGAPFTSVRRHLFTNRALACKLPEADPGAPIESYTVAAAHEAGWIWDIGLNGARGLGCVYSADHMGEDRAAEILAGYVGHDRYSVRTIAFEPGYRTAPWTGNCVAVGLSGGFLEPLEATGIVLIEAAAAMIADLLPIAGPVDAPARRFNTLMTARYEAITAFLKLHYCLSRREEPFWRDNADPATIPDALLDLLAQWRHRPPSRFDFLIDVESFAFFNYQYVLYGMDFAPEGIGTGRPAPARAAALFDRIRHYGDLAVADLPSHRTAIDQMTAAAS